MAKYRFLTTDITTGRVLMDNIPITAQSASMQINGIGSFSGSVQLGRTDIDQTLQSAMVEAIEPWKAVLWVLQNEYPVWAGPIVGWQPTSAQDGTLPFQAATMETILQYRVLHDQALKTTVVTDTGANNRLSKEWSSPAISNMLPVTPMTKVQAASVYNYVTYAVQVGVDIFDLVRAVCRYAISKPITDASGNALPVPTAALAVACVQSASNDSGVTVLNQGDVIIDPAQYQTVYEFINGLVTKYGFEWCIQPGLTSAGNLALTLQQGLPLGRTQQSTNLVFNYPSKSCIDYAFTRQSQNPANAVYAYGIDNLQVVKEASQYPHGFDVAEMTTGYPVLEGAVQVPHDTSNTPSAALAQCNAYADGYMFSQSILGQVTPTVTLGADSWPQLSQMQLGDQVVFTATSPLHPADPNSGAPGLQVLCRVIGWTLSFPGPNQAESTQVNLSSLSQVFA